MVSNSREQWGTRTGFVLAAVGSAVGLGNIWRFPYLAYENGGGAFFIPFLFALFTAGIPILILELSMGQKYRGSAPLTYARINSKWEWVGWWQAFIAFVIAVYYVAIIGWAMAYAYFSLGQAWGTDATDFFLFTYLGLSDGPFQLGGIQLGVLVPVVLAWLVIYLALRGGVKKGIEFANKVFMPILLVLLIFMAIRAVTLPGAAEGLNYLFKPDFSQIWNYQVWAAAYGQVFFSLSICFAIMIAYASYLPKKTDVVNNGFMVGFLDVSISLLAGFAVFGVLGFMAAAQGVGVGEVAAGGVGLAFMVFPTAITEMPVAPGLFGLAFFISLVVAGLSSAISINEAVVSSLMDKFNSSRKKVVNIYCAIAFLISMLFVTGAGLHILDIADAFINQFGIVFAGLVQVILLGWFFNLKKLQDHVNPMSEFHAGPWWIISLKYITPIVLGYMAIANLYGNIVENYEGYGTFELIVVGWMVALGALLLGVAMQSLKWKNRDLNEDPLKERLDD